MTTTIDIWLHEHEEIVTLPASSKTFRMQQCIYAGERYFRDGDILAVSDHSMAETVTSSRPIED